jgi:hypothetical protein
MPKKKKKSQRGKTVKSHPQVKKIEAMLKSGYSPSRVCDWLEDMGFKPVSVQTIRAYRDNFLDAKLILPPSVYEKKIKQLDVHIDTLRELYNLIAIQKIRLAPLLETEDAHSRAHPDTRHELTLLRDTIVKAIALEMELGVREKASIKIETKEFDMAELLRMFLEHEDARALRMFLEHEDARALQEAINK